MRERLIQLLSQYFDIGDSYTYNLTRDKAGFAVGTVDLDDFEEYTEDDVANLADYLLENGVIVPPCKIGDTIFVIETELRNKNKIRSYIVARKVTGICGNNLCPLWVTALERPYEYRYHPTEFGKTVFLTREAAEAALKARENK